MADASIVSPIDGVIADRKTEPGQMAAPGAAGQRFLCLCDGPTISFLDLAEILRRRLGPLGERVKVKEEPGQDPPSLVIHNERARTQLGWRPRPLETVIAESAESLRDLGLLS